MEKLIDFMIIIDILHLLRKGAQQSCELEEHQHHIHRALAMRTPAEVMVNRIS